MAQLPRPRQRGSARLAALEGGRLSVRCAPLDLACAAREARDLMEDLAATQRLQLSAELATPTWVQADALRLRQVLLNLLGNALKFTPPGGQVGLHLSTGARHALLEVRDSGPGMDALQLSQLFVPFARLGAERLGIDVLELLVKVLNDDKLKEGYLSWNIRFTIDEFHHWSARTGIIDHLNPLRRKTLVRLLREQLDPESVRGRMKKSDEDDSEKDVEMPYSPALAALENGLEVPGETESIPDEVPEEGLVVNVGESSFSATEEDLSAIGHQTETEPTVQ